MIIKNASEDDIRKALRKIQGKYDENLCFLELKPTNRKGNRFQVRLYTHSSEGKGARRGFQRTKSGKRNKLRNACWHVHGDFFDALLNINTKAVVSVNELQIYRDNGTIQNNWIDWNCGSDLYNNIYMSTLCECRKGMKQ